MNFGRLVLALIVAQILVFADLTQAQVRNVALMPGVEVDLGKLRQLSQFLRDPEKGSHVVHYLNELGLEVVFIHRTPPTTAISSESTKCRQKPTPN